MVFTGTIQTKHPTFSLPFRAILWLQDKEEMRKATSEEVII